MSISCSAVRAFQDLKYISAVKSRGTGTAGDWRAMRYVSRVFRKSGLEVKFDAFEALAFDERSSRLTVLLPEQRELKARALLYSSPTVLGGVEGEPIFARFGGEEDYEAVDARGKIVVIRRAPDKDSWWKEVSIASERGAVALVVVDNYPYLFSGTVETGLFAPQDRFRDVPRPIPSVVTSKEDGEYLLELVGTSAKVRLEVDAVTESRSTRNIRGIIRGRGKNREKVVITAHRDSANTPGANDNGSGTVVLLELSRALAQKKPNRTIELVSLGAEEFFGQIGAQNYCKTHKEELRNIKALVNIDMVAVGSEIKIITEGHWPDRTIKHTQWINRLLSRTAKELGYKAGYGTCVTGCSDESRFIDAGVPSAWLWKPDDPCYHTSEDTVEKVNANDIKAAADIVGTAVLQIVNGRS